MKTGRPSLERFALASLFSAGLSSCGSASYELPLTSVGGALQLNSAPAPVAGVPVVINLSSLGSADPTLKSTPPRARECDADPGRGNTVTGDFKVYGNNCVISYQVSSSQLETIIAAGDFFAADLLVKFSRTFKDEFDFIVLALDVPDSQPAPSFGYWGQYQSLGSRLPARSRRLLGHIQLPFGVDPIVNGPFLHEIFHEWGQRDALPGMVPDASHWGYSGTQGQLGGFDPATLVPIGSTANAAGQLVTTWEAAIRPFLPADASPSPAKCRNFTHSFGTQSNGGNGLPFGPLEMFLMGLLPGDQLEPVIRMSDTVWLGERLTTADGPGGSSSSVTRFTATSKTTVDVATIRTRLGLADPARQPVQTDFRAAYVTITAKAALDPATVAARRKEAVQMSLQAMPAEFAFDGCQTRYNVYTATGGKANIAFGGLRESLR